MRSHENRSNPISLCPIWRSCFLEYHMSSHYFYAILLRKSRQYHPSRRTSLLHQSFEGNVQIINAMALNERFSSMKLRILKLISLQILGSVRQHRVWTNIQAICQLAVRILAWDIENCSDSEMQQIRVCGFGSLSRGIIRRKHPWQLGLMAVRDVRRWLDFSRYFES